jgi:glycosyltransferase involved in cell wall biosynthesis
MGPLPGDVHKTVLIHTHATPTRSNGTGPDLHGTDVAIVHDYLNQRGGAERVVLEMSDIWPQAPIYTSLYRADSTFPGFHGRDVRTTLLDRLPIDRGFRNLFPLYPAAFRALGEIAADVVISSSSGWSHMARSVPDALHVVYCYTPARWLYRHDHLATAHERSFQRALARPSLRSLRGIDCRAAHRADLYIAISQAVQRRIKHVYGIDAALVHPPVDIDRFHPTPRGERLLVVSRLLPYKRVGLIVEAATQMGIGLDVVGDGPLLPALRAAAGPSVEFHGAVGDRAVAELMQGCRAACVAAEEDFGLVAVEAQASGKPVVAYAGGGALETVEEGLTGAFFRQHTTTDLIEAITAVERIDTSPEQVAERAQRFSRATFRSRLTAEIDAALSRRSAAGPRFGSSPSAVEPHPSEAGLR